MKNIKNILKYLFKNYILNVFVKNIYKCKKIYI